MQGKMFDFIVVRIKTEVWVLFEDNFINGNAFRTQNSIIEVLKLLYPENEFEVNLMTHKPEN